MEGRCKRGRGFSHHFHSFLRGLQMRHLVPENLEYIPEPSPPQIAHSLPLGVKDSEQMNLEPSASGEAMPCPRSGIAFGLPLCPCGLTYQSPLCTVSPSCTGRNITSIKGQIELVRACFDIVQRGFTGKAPSSQKAECKYKHWRTKLQREGHGLQE